MNYRLATILPKKTLSSSGTETIDINVQQPISRLDLIWEATKGLNYMTAPAAHDISRIELVDGSNILHSLSGAENQALCIYDRRVPTMNNGEHLITLGEVSVYGIDFGRWLFDPELAFDPTKFLNPQLKVTYNYRVADTSASAGYLTVRAHIFDEKTISPIGFLMSKEHHNEANPANDSFKYVALPTDFPLRKILIRAYRDGYTPWDQIEGIRLDEDNEKRVPIDIELEPYYQVMKGIWAAVEEQLAVAVVASSEVFYVTPTDYMLSVAGIDGATISLTTWQPGGKVTLLSSSPTSMPGVVRGYLPNACFEFPFGNSQDIADWYDVTRVGSLRLRVRGGVSGTGYDYQVVLQQLRRY